MNQTLIIILAGILASAAEIIGGSLVVFKSTMPKRIQEYLLALGAGFLLALVIMELIPESLEGIGSSAPIWILLGFSVIHLVEHTIVGHLHFGEETHHDVMVSKVASYSAFGGLFIHAFFDGLAISSGMFYNFELGVMIFFAILLHKFPEGLTIASIMLAARHPKKTALLASAGIGVSTMLGILMIFFLKTVDASMTGIAFAFSAGSALYVGASDVIPEINHSHNRVIPVMVFIGMLLFYLSAGLIEHMLGH